MLSTLNKYLSPFKECFRETRTFVYLCCSVVAFMLVSNDSAVSAMVRALFLDPGSYERLLKFIKSEAYSTDDLTDLWVQSVEKSSSAFIYKERNILVVDHTKVPKEARRMPACKAQHQDSEDFSKPETIYGHHIGMVGMVVGTWDQLHCVPMKSEIHEGTEEISKWRGEDPKTRSERMIVEALSVAEILDRDCYVVGDRDFSAKIFFRKVKEFNQKHGKKADAVVRFPSNTSCKRRLTEEEREAYKKEGRRGRPRKWTDLVYPVQWFTEKREEFQERTLKNGQTILCYAQKEVWHGIELLFVLSETPDGKRMILATTDLTLAPEEAVEIYLTRFTIETAFSEMKHIVFAYGYHYWTIFIEKLNKYNGKTRLSRVSGDSRERVEKCVGRIERHINIAGIALGILQLMTLEAGIDISPEDVRFQRTYRHKDRLSVSQVKELLVRNFPFLLMQSGNDDILGGIRELVSPKLLSLLKNGEKAA